MNQKIAAMIGLALGSAIGGTISYGIYGTFKDKGWNPWAAGAMSGGASAVMGVGLAFVANKLAGGETGALPARSNLRTLANGLTATAVGAMTPGVPRLGPVKLGAYVANPLGAYTADRVGCADCG